MRKTLATLCLITTTIFATGCAESPRNEGRAAAILDAVERPAKAHARALAGDDPAEMRRTGAALLAPLRCWWTDDCTKPLTD